MKTMTAAQHREEIGRCIRTNRKGVWLGSLVDLVMYVMIGTNRRQNFSLEPNRVWDLFCKDLPGYLGMDWRCTAVIRVRRKPFVRWVRQNWTRLIQNKVERQQEAKRIDDDFDFEQRLALEDFIRDHPLGRPLVEAAPKPAEETIAEVLAPPDILDAQLDSPEVGLTSRVYDPLTKAGVETVHVLILHSEQELLAIPGIGPAAIVRIRQFLDENDLKLKGDETMA